jgi:mRNA interferase HicA
VREYKLNGEQFKRAVRNFARQASLPYREDNRGKGSHSRIFLGERFTTVKHGEIGRGLLAQMCKQLGIRKEDL